MIAIPQQVIVPRRKIMLPAWPSRWSAQGVSVTPMTFNGVACRKIEVIDYVHPEGGYYRFSFNTYGLAFNNALFRLTFRYYIPSTNAEIDEIYPFHFTVGGSVEGAANVLDAWSNAQFFIKTGTGGFSNLFLNSNPIPTQNGDIWYIADQKIERLN